MFPPVTASKVCYWRTFESADRRKVRAGLTLMTEYATFEPEMHVHLGLHEGNVHPRTRQ